MRTRLAQKEDYNQLLGLLQQLNPEDSEATECRFGQRCDTRPARTCQPAVVWLPTVENPRTSHRSAVADEAGNALPRTALTRRK